MGETKNLGPELERIRKQGQEQVSGNDENEQTGSDKTHARELTITPEIRAGYDKKVAADKKRREEEESEKKRNEIKHARGIPITPEFLQQMDERRARLAAETQDARQAELLQEQIKNVPPTEVIDTSAVEQPPSKTDGGKQKKGFWNRLFGK